MLRMPIKNDVSTGTATAAAFGGAKPAWRPDSLPPFPAIALQALKLIAGRDTSLLELCDLIRSDVAFSTAVLRFANSPLVAFSRNITNVVQASMLLGFQRLKSIVVTVGLKAYLQGPVVPLVRSCWRHSVACAIIAERAALEGGREKDFAYTAGIMHDIGRAAMIAAAPTRYAEVLMAEADDPRELLTREREIFGVDHCQAGGSLVKAWKLPPAFLEVTSRHHDCSPGAPGVTSIVFTSCSLADALGFGMLKYRSARTHEEIVSLFPEVARKGFPESSETLAAEIENEIRVMEAV